MIQIDISKIRNTRKHYKKNGIPFIYKSNLTSISVESKMGSYTSNSNSFPSKELYFIKHVKQYIIKNDLHNAAKQAAIKSKDYNMKPAYFGYNKKLKAGDLFDTVYNVDINSAYWKTAFDMGLLSDDLYKTGMDKSKISKKTRLAAIGSLARKVDIYEFDGKTERLIESKSEETEFVWDIICYKVGRLLTTIARELHDDFIFFWVDGIYLTNKRAADRAQKLFKKYGYDSDITKLINATVTKNKILVKTGKKKMKFIDGKKIETDIKPFHYNKKKNYKI